MSGAHLGIASNNSTVATSPRGCVVLSEQLAAAEVEIVATDALVRADLLPAQAHEPADSSVARSVGPP